MRQDEDLWMKKMREAFKEYSEPSPPKEWVRLEEKLTPVKRRIRPYTWWVSAAVILLAVFGVSLLFIQNPAVGDICPTAAPALTVIPDGIPETKEPELLVTQAKPAEWFVGTKPYIRISEMGETEKGMEAIPAIKEEPDESSETIRGGTNREENKQDHCVGKRPDRPSGDARVVARPSGRDKWHLPVASEKRRASDGKWSIAASFSNAAGASSAQTQDYLVMVDMFSSTSNVASPNMISIKDKAQLVFEGGMPYLRETMPISEIKHKQPISFGLSVRKNLSKGFSVESGATYTLLSSEGKTVDDSSLKIEQKLHYIGIPLRGNWNFVDSKRFTLYLTAGGMVEKCIYGKIGSQRYTVKPLQFSLSGGIGGQLNVTDHIGIYVEPGVSYYFDDGSNVETIRKENPLNFNLQGGIRFTY